MATTDPNQIADPNDPLKTTNPPGVNGGIAAPTATLPPAATPPVVTPSSYTAVPYTVPKEGLVQQQVLDIVGKDSPLLRQAESRMTQKMNERGLVNSSIAIGAGHEAVIAQALPMAQQDAQTYANAETNTVNQQNAALQFNTGQANQVALANQQSAVQLANTRMNNEAQLAFANLDAQTRMALSTMDANTRQLLQTNQSASNAYVQAVTNIANISMNKELTPEAKDRAVQTQLNLLRAQLRTIGEIASTDQAAISDLDLAQYFKRLQQGPSSDTASSGTASSGSGSQPINSSTLTDVQRTELNNISSDMKKAALLNGGVIPDRYLDEAIIRLQAVGLSLTRKQLRALLDTL